MARTAPPEIPVDQVVMTREVAGLVRSKATALAVALPDVSVKSPPANSFVPSGVTLSDQTLPETFGLFHAPIPGQGDAAVQGVPTADPSACSAATPFMAI